MICRYNIRPLSPLITPLMSDTIFGHFCWALRYDKGQDFLVNFLECYGAGKKAPVLFSSAFISGQLPRPALPPPRMKMIRSFVKNHFIDDSETLSKKMTDKEKFFLGMTYVKAWGKRDHLTIDQWIELRDNYSEPRVFEAFFKQYKDGHGEGVSQHFKKEVSASNTINRLSGTVSPEGGGLFQREKVWYDEGTKLDLYVEVNSMDLTPFVNDFLTLYLPRTGYGADKTVGMGELEISADDTFDQVLFSDSRDFDARLSLSLASFPGIEKYNAFYRLKTKFGKLGGDFALSSPTGGSPKPFKRPILMYEPGAVFLCTEDLKDKQLLNKVHSDQQIRHCGVPLTLPFKISEDISYANIPS